MTQDANQSGSHLQDINQEFKEKEVQEKAKELGFSYINLLNFKVNPDILQLLNEEDSHNSNMVVFFQIGKKIRVALTDPENFFAKNLIQNFKNEHYAVNVNIASEESIRKVQEGYKSKLYKQEEKKEIQVEEKEDVIAEEALKEFEEKQEEVNQAPSATALDDFHALAVKMKASDVHFQAEESGAQVRFRIDGILQTITHLEKKAYDGIVKQVKFNAHLKLNIVNQAQDGQYFFSINQRSVDVRVSTVPSVFGETLVLRLLDPKKGIVPLSDLGFKKYALEKVANVLSKPEGMILLTGPTGAGKTTTLYSILDVLNRPHRKIITLEDPVEYKLPGVVQCEVVREKNDDTFSFSDGLVAALRQDPDIIMVGEIREPKVANTAVQAAMTGHLVLSTLHTNSAIETISRLMNLGVADYTLAPSLNALIAQRLVRRVCKHCTAERDWSIKALENLKLTYDALKARKIDVPEIPKQEKYGKGCEHCNQTGFSGRITAVEVLPISDNLRTLIQSGSDEKVILETAEKEGFVTMREDALIKVLSAETTFDEVVRVLG